jgi:peptidyl-tRNA hydrolase
MSGTLYILSRIDLLSMNPGKAVAQGCHSANQFMFNANRSRNEHYKNINDQNRKSLGADVPTICKKQQEFVDLVDEWENSTSDGFGVTICLGVNYDQLKSAVLVARAMGFEAAITHDPSYPLMDGSFLHLLPLDTGGYVFGDKEALFPVLGHLKLMP